MFEQFDNESLNLILDNLRQSLSRAREKQYWHASFKDGAERAELFKKTAEFFESLAKTVEQTLLERAMLEAPLDVQVDPQTTT